MRLSLPPKSCARVCALSLMLLPLSSCASIRTLISGTDREPAPRAIPCEALAHFEPSRQDTDGTIRQAIVWNRVIDRFCGQSTEGAADAGS